MLYQLHPQSSRPIYDKWANFSVASCMHLSVGIVILTVDIVTLTADNVTLIVETVTINFEWIVFCDYLCHVND